MGKRASIYRYSYLSMDESTYMNLKTKYTTQKCFFAFSECLYDKDLLLAENGVFLIFLTER